MKNLLLGLLFLPLLTLGQARNQPFKGVNTIIIQTQDSSHVAFKKLQKAFIEAGYTIGEADFAKGIVDSNPRSEKKLTCRVNSTIFENTKCVIEITGVFNSTTTQIFLGNPHGFMGNSPGFMGNNTPSYPIAYKGSEGSGFMRSFLLMQKIGLNYPGAVLLYEKR